MKKYPILSFLSAMFLLVNCGDNSEEPRIDCTQSDLSISVVSSIKSDCDQPGSIVVEATGGEGEYTFSADGTTFQESETFAGLFAGVFNLVVQDAVGCTSSTTFTLESEPTGITLSLESTTSNCRSNTGTITANAIGGVGDLQFSLDGSDFSSATNYSGISAGDHTVTAKDEEECEVTKTIQVLTNVSLENDIMPIISQNCAISGCHNGSQSPRLATKDEVVQNATQIKIETQAGTMPRDGELSQTEIDLIACWVDDGAPNN